MNAPAAPAPSARRLAERWRWPVVLALLATVPAFYVELLAAAPQAWSDLAYATAAAVLAGSMAHVAGARRGWRHLLRAQGLDVLLVIGLLAAALAPPSSRSSLALLLRMAVAFATLARMVQALRHWITRGGVAYLMGVAFVVLLACGAGFWWLEPRTPTLSEGLWLAFTTAATVGYGDIVPSTPASRIFSVFVVLLGYGVLSLATAAIATSWIETEERRLQRETLQDLHRQIGWLRGEIAAMRAEQQTARNAGH